MKFDFSADCGIFSLTNRTGEDEFYDEYEGYQWTAMTCWNMPMLLMKP